MVLGSAATSLELVRNAHSAPAHAPTELESLEMGPRNLCVDKHSGGFLCMLKFENCCKGRTSSVSVVTDTNRPHLIL